MKYVVQDREVDFPSNADIDAAIARARVLRSHALYEGAVELAGSIKRAFAKLGLGHAKKPAKTSGGVMAAY